MERIIVRKAFISPSKYVQGENELLNLGYFVKTFGASALLIANPDDVERVRPQLDETSKRFGIKLIEAGFGGECTREEVKRLQDFAKENSCDCTIGLGGGKAIDTAKCVAEGEALIIAPTIAATDAPTSHSAVLYTADGQFDDYAYFKASPSVVLVDTSVIAKAPTRFLVSGMGDALATYFEMRATQESYSNVNAGLPCGAREGVCPPAKGTLTARVMAETCYQVLLEDGLKAKQASDLGVVTPALENIVEANILLSGLGFESGGLAASHAIHDGLTILEEAHAYFHGEKVAFGTLCQLFLENASTEEIDTFLDFCISVGLPVCFKDLGVANVTEEQYAEIAQKTCIPEESVHAMPFPITEEGVISAIKAADKYGETYKNSKGV